MGLFDKKACVHCGKECGVMGRTKTADGKYLCTECADLAGDYFDSYEHTYEQFLEKIEKFNENEARLMAFNIQDSFYDKVFVDMEKNQIIVSKKTAKDKDALVTKHCHVYNVEDLRFFHQDIEIKKQENSVFGTTVTVDFSSSMVFEDEFEPCPLKGVIDSGRKVKIKGVFNKRAEGLYKEDDVRLLMFVNKNLTANGFDRPLPFDKGVTVEELDPYAPWFGEFFKAEKKKYISSSQANTILDELCSELGVLKSTSMPGKIRKRFGIK